MPKGSPEEMQANTKRWMDWIGREGNASRLAGSFRQREGRCSLRFRLAEYVVGSDLQTDNRQFITKGDN